MTLTEAVKVTYDMIGCPISDLQLAVTVDDLTHYPEAAVLVALSRCRKELKRSLALVDILDRIPGGHPGVEQAWAMVSQAMHDESRSLVWSDEMREAYGAAHLVGEDAVAARMTFKEVYGRAVNEARNANRPIAWTLSKGTDKVLADAAIQLGLQEGKLSLEYSQRLLSEPSNQEAFALLNQLAPKLLMQFTIPKPPRLTQEATNAPPLP